MAQKEANTTIPTVATGRRSMHHPHLAAGFTASAALPVEVAFVPRATSLPGRPTLCAPFTGVRTWGSAPKWPQETPRGAGMGTGGRTPCPSWPCKAARVRARASPCPTDVFRVWETPSQLCPERDTHGRGLSASWAPRVVSSYRKSPL